MKKILFLSIISVKNIHEKQINQHGGTPGLRDKNLLDSAIHMPESGIGGQYFHSDIFQMAAAYAYHIIKGHPFVDGNKRTGMAAALVFLKINNVSIELTNFQIVSIGEEIASSKISKKEVAKIFQQTCKKI